MKTVRAFVVGLTLLAALQRSPAAQNSRDGESFGKPLTPPQRDPVIAGALRKISTDRIRASIEKLVGFGTRNTLASMVQDLPSGQGINAAADWIESQFQEYSKSCGGCLEVKRDAFTAPAQTRIPQPTRLVNVYAVLRGSDPDESQRVYLVTGHYDSRNTDVMDVHGAAPGANDDASGTAVSLECARVLSQQKFPATLVFAAVAGEEQGLVGSAHLAKLARQEGWQLGGVLNNDIVGGNTTPGEKGQDKSTVRVFSEAIPATATPEQRQLLERVGGESDSPSRELAREVTEVAATYFGNAAAPFHAELVFRLDRFLRGGDHASFNREGFAAVRFTEWREDFNHQHQNVRTENGVEYGDELKFVDFDYVARVARLNAAALAVMATAPGAPTEVRVSTRNLDNDSILKWKGARASGGYEIVWRETSAPNWQRYVEAPEPGGNHSEAEHSLTIPVSKDNVIFGVRAVAASGERSLAVMPLPER